MQIIVKRILIERCELVAKLIDKYQIRSYWIQHILELRNFEIAIVIDDSGSMTTPVDDTERTRWAELCEIIKRILPIALAFDSNGVDLHCLNGEKYLKIKNAEDVEHVFAREPMGFTPLVPVLQGIFQSSLANKGQDKKLLVFVATDGKPTNDEGDEDIGEFESLMRYARNAKTTYVSFLLCTDDPVSVGYLEGWDKSMDNVDVTDDYQSELTKIRQCQENENFTFTKEDYIVKALVGAIVPHLDRLNENKIDRLL